MVLYTYGRLYFDQNIVQLEYAGVLDVAGDSVDHAQSDMVGGVLVGQELNLFEGVKDQAVVPKAAMESTPRNWPITTPSIMEPTEEEKDSSMNAVSWI